MTALHHLGQQLTGDVEKAVERGVEYSMPIGVGHHEHHVVSTDAGIIY